MKTNTPKWWWFERGLLLLISHAVEGRVTPLPAARVPLDADASGAFAYELMAQANKKQDRPVLLCSLSV